MRVAMFGRVRVYHHAAYRILDALLRLFVRTVLSMVCMGLGLLCCHDDPSLSAGHVLNYMSSHLASRAG